MCLNTIRILNQQKHLPLHGGSYLRVNVPCGKCAECQNKKSNEYYLRSTYEAMSTFANGGYLLFDTLTYSDSNLPHISRYVDGLSSSLDYPCFDYHDVRKFLALLRRHLSKRYDISKNLRYFLSSEYGTSDTGTHRPHYHVLFFVTAPIDPIELSAEIAACWCYGRTDGIRYKSRDYVIKKRVISSANYSLSQLQKITTYVTKYVAKSSLFDKEINKRLDEIVKQKYSDYRCLEAKEYRRQLTRFIGQFHRQSEGFGLSALDSPYNSIERIKETGMMYVVDPYKVLRKIPLPQYFARKLFYDLVVEPDKAIRFVLNEEGINYKLSSIERVVDNVARRFDNWRMDLPSFNPHYESLLSQVDNLLDGRTWMDFAKYLLFYKGRMKSPEQRERESRGFYYCEPLDVQLCSIYFPNNQRIVYNHATLKDLKEHGSRFINFGYSEQKSSVAAFVSKSIFLDKSVDADNNVLLDLSKKCLPHEFSYDLEISEKSDPRFSGFDSIYDLYVSSLHLLNLQKQRAYDVKQELSQSFKAFACNNLNPLSIKNCKTIKPYENSIPNPS